MPRCRKCGTHWFNSAIRKCPICRTETVDGLAVDLSNQIRSRPGWSGNPQAVAAQLLSDDPVLRKAALDVLAKAQTRVAFRLLESVAWATQSEMRYDTLRALYAYPQYADELMPLLLAVASEPDDGSRSQGMALTVIRNCGQSAIAYLMEHRSEVATPKLFWQAMAFAADNLSEADGTRFAELILGELQAENVEPEGIESFLLLQEKRWLPVDELVEYSLALLESHSDSSSRNSAANVLFHLSSKSEAAKKGLETLMRDDVLGIRSRAVQVCGQDKANRQVVQLLSKAANLESIVERGADDRMWTSEQLLKDIERTVGQSFKNTAACLDWIRKNCFVN